jgi:hypothetical protein
MKLLDILQSIRNYADTNNRTTSVVIDDLIHLHSVTPLSLTRFEVGKKYRLKPEYWGDRIYWTDYFAECGTSSVFMVEKVDGSGDGWVSDYRDGFLVASFKHIHMYEEVG